MARTSLTAQRITAAGLTVTLGAVDAEGAQFRNTGRNWIRVKNASGASITVTPKIGKTVLGQSVTSPAITVAAGAEKEIGPFADDYEQPGGKDTVFVDFSAVTSVTVALLTI